MKLIEGVALTSFVFGATLSRRLSGRINNKWPVARARKNDFAEWF